MKPSWRGTPREGLLRGVDVPPEKQRNPGQFLHDPGHGLSQVRAACLHVLETRAHLDEVVELGVRGAAVVVQAPTAGIVPGVDSGLEHLAGVAGDAAEARDVHADVPAPEPVEELRARHDPDVDLDPHGEQLPAHLRRCLPVRAPGVEGDAEASGIASLREQAPGLLRVRDVLGDLRVEAEDEGGNELMSGDGPAGAFVGHAAAVEGLVDRLSHPPVPEGVGLPACVRRDLLREAVGEVVQPDVGVAPDLEAARPLEARGGRR